MRMSKPFRQAETLTVDGIEYSWEYRHGWGVDWGVGLRGASVSVCLRRRRTRELIVDFPFSVFGVKTPPKNSVLIRHLATAIRTALSAGWQPDSRGKPFRFNVTYDGL
jgi:hypothetical protein